MCQYSKLVLPKTCELGELHKPQVRFWAQSALSFLPAKDGERDKVKPYMNPIETKIFLNVI